MGLRSINFILEPSGHDSHARASRAALLVYANQIKDVDYDLYSNLKSWVKREEFMADATYPDCIKTCSIIDNMCNLCDKDCCRAGSKPSNFE